MIVCVCVKGLVNSRSSGLSERKRDDKWIIGLFLSVSACFCFVGYELVYHFVLFLLLNYVYKRKKKDSEGETVSLIKGKIYYLRWFLNVVYETKMNEYVTKEFSSVIL